MTNEELMNWAFPGFVTACMVVIGFFIARLIRGFDDMEKSAAQCKVEQATIKGDIGRDISQLRYHLAENYATKLDANQLRSEALAIRAETHASLERIHERIDQLPKEIISLVRKGSIE
ncbi:hypothetical protein [Limnoglobus roseus]|uniref:Uncharacterized protein n=1 Tax=Limnoglobus roseus TaxID=2598579 RepID=A0A5C1AMI6_9BACT|nr:hypothetical protein [Limnoglobus roseus]QEL19347.1 hypothetical protein PX52LOC_06416 [Limnoglobus roseus]